MMITMLDFEKENVGQFIEDVKEKTHNIKK
jgi:hypothetical protein